MADLGSHSTLLALPLELRELIYKEVLANPTYGPQLLQTCREIYEESRKFLYQRPIVFRGQSALYEWLEQASPEYLVHVTDITLELEDVDLHPLLSPIQEGSSSPIPRLRAWELHEQELAKLRTSLSKFPSVKTLSLRALPERQSFLFRDFLATFLDLLSTIYPTLTALGLSGNFHHQSLAFLASLPALESFTYDGFSALSAADTARKLAELPNLIRLSLVSHHEVLQPPDYRLSKFTAETQGFTGEVLSTIERLTSFSLTERTHPESLAILFFTPDILASLHNHRALRNLSICLAKPPEPETLEALEEYLERASLRRLELDWPDLDPEVLEMYTLVPEGLRDLWVRVGSMAAAFDVLYPVVDCRGEGDLEELRRMVLVREVWEGEGKQVLDQGASDQIREGGEEDGRALGRRSGRTTGDGAVETGQGSKTDTVDARKEVSVRRMDSGNEDEEDEDEPAFYDTDEANVRRATRMLKRLGVKVSWCTISVGSCD